MPWYTYRCLSHGDFRISASTRLPSARCSVCGKDGLPVIKAGTSSVRERLDNGAMARAVERVHNIEELIEDHAATGDVVDENQTTEDDDSGS